MKRIILTVLTAPAIFLLIILSFSVSAETIDFSGMDSIVSDYNSGSIDIAQLITNVNRNLKSQYQTLEKDGHLEGFTDADVEQMFEGKNEIVKRTKDFNLRFEPYKSEGKYFVIWGLAPSQKAIDNKVGAAKDFYVETKLQQKKDAIDTSSEEEEVENLKRQKIQKLKEIKNKENENITEGLKNEVTQLEDEILELEYQIEEEHNIEKGDIVMDIDEEQAICSARYDENVKIRKLFEESVPDFPKWYFDQFKKGVDDYFSMESGHSYLMNQISENLEAINELESCADSKANLGKIEVDYDMGSEKFKIWEKDGEIYYQFYFMPSKAMMKEIIETKVENPSVSATGYRLDEGGRMKKIEKLAGKYGGSFDTVVKIVDNAGNNIFYKHITINPDVIISSKTVSENPEDVDVTLEIKYDAMYEYMEYVSKDVQGTKPLNADWEKNGDSLSAKDLLGILTKGFKLWITGVKVKPITEVPGLLFNLGLITEALGE